jgi:uncharacterized protein YjbI with pentapeptide repeats
MSEEKREISFQELVRILIEHRKWIVSGKKQGQQANLRGIYFNPKKINLRMAFLQGANLSETVLNEVNLVQADLHRANLIGADLRGAKLFEADLHRAFLSATDLNGAFLIGCDLHRANLIGADLRGANLFGADIRKADLSTAELNGAFLHTANFRGAFLGGADLRGAFLSDAKFHKAQLPSADLRGAILNTANFDGANVEGVKYDRTGKYRGIRVESCYGSPQFKRHAQDHDWLEEFLDTRKTWWQKRWAWFWKVSSDYGRSFGRWAFLSSLFAVLFGCLFYILGPGAFDVAHLPEYPSPWGLVSMIYYSVVTFTTLGFGDIVPKTIPAAILVMAEVILGYIMLGGLISILANKLARRS